MNLEEYLVLVADYTDDYDRTAVIRAYHEYRKENPVADTESAHRHIQMHLPREGTIILRNILNDFGTACAYEVDKAVRWLRQQRYTIADSLCGPCTDIVAANALRVFLINAISVQSEFEGFCNELGTRFTLAMYADFKRHHGSYLVSTRHHPYLTDLDFWMGSTAELHNVFAKWYMGYSACDPCDRNGYMSVAECAEMLEIKVPNLINWVWAHPECYVLHKGRCLISKAKVDALQIEWQNVYMVADILIPRLDQIPSKSRPKVKTETMELLRQQKSTWILSDDSYPQQRSNVLYTTQPVIAGQFLEEIVRSYPVIPLGCLKDVTGMSFKHLKEKVSAGCIRAEMDHNGNYFISLAECRRVEALHHQYIAIDDIVADCLSCTTSNYSHIKRYDRDNLMDFCEEHNWWGLDYVRCDDIPLDGKLFGVALLREDKEQLIEYLTLWIQGYQKTHSDRFKLLTNRFLFQFPATTRKLISYEKQVHSADNPLVDMTQLLYSSLSTELHTMTDGDIERMVEVYRSNTTIAACKVLADFLLYGNYTKRAFRFDPTGIQIDTAAYSVVDFAIMVWHVVNEEVIAKEELISKAVDNKRFADLWLYIALHVYASWRSTDYIRMVPPRLPYPPEETLKKVKCGELTEQEVVYIAEYFVEANRLLGMTPNKTRGASGVPELYFYVPQSCLASFGRILAIAAAHYQLTDSESFVVPVTDWYTIKQFFGSDFLKACGNRPFSGRRANKALLQSVEFVGREDSQLPPMITYHLASIMRSHKLSCGKPSMVTDIYLRDANFAGQAPEYVAYQMFERGVCSFVVDVMLEKCYGREYTRLSVGQKTQAITELGLSPAGAAGVLQCIQIAQDRAVETLAEVCQDNATIESALKMIASGRGHGKDQDVYCLCKAAGKTCLHRDRLSCLGCKYEIKTKALLLRYAVVHQSLASADGTSDAEQIRRKYLYTNVTWPAMMELLSHLEHDTIPTEFNLYRNLVEEAMTYGITSNCVS